MKIMTPEELLNQIQEEKEYSLGKARRRINRDIKKAMLAGVDYILINNKDLPKTVKEDLVLAGYTVKKGIMGTTIIKWK